MPVYEFKCEKCGHEFENRRGFDDPNPPCPAEDDKECTCGGETRKLISKTSFVLKGSGWYKDGY